MIDDTLAQKWQKHLKFKTKRSQQNEQMNPKTVLKPILFIELSQVHSTNKKDTKSNILTPKLSKKISTQKFSISKLASKTKIFPKFSIKQVLKTNETQNFQTFQTFRPPALRQYNKRIMCPFNFQKTVYKKPRSRYQSLEKQKITEHPQKVINNFEQTKKIQKWISTNIIDYKTIHKRKSISLKQLKKTEKSQYVSEFSGWQTKAQEQQ